MHELSIALSIVEGAEEEIERQGGGQVCAVHLKLGLLSGVVREALLFSYELACDGTALQGSSLMVEEIPIHILCEACGIESGPVSAQRLECAACGASQCLVIQGTELEVFALEFAA